ncbi:NACHT domain-containing protein [Crocosphaera sp. UHCC 0190]|uniref:NACHT domain-containing protein n=1 Tax=Crocosphaera sp. UHCC 0190 TaxID=3110246 RepID=UPI002B21D21D|nr:NACHT domain-containing protein [Crocosphaera sp. UHCC 0190]MEA5508343.1 NACHT domain-containing protein [Crocosphaera sp. UHCC 0190]
MSENNPNPQPTQPSSRQEARKKRVQEVLKFLKILGFPVSGGGVAGTIILLKNGQYELAAITIFVSILALVIAIGGKFISRVINRILDSIETELENLEEPLANWIVKLLKTFSIKLWWQLNPSFQRKYYDSLIDSFRELKIEGFRIGLPALDLENVFVSLRVKTGTPDNIHGVIIPSQIDEGDRQIWDFLSNIKQFLAYRRLAVIAVSGSGKTTLLKHLTLTYAKEKHQEYQAPKFIPILLYLRNIRHQIATENPPKLPQLIREHIQNLPADPPLILPPNWLEDQLKLGKCLVMLDGLDEVADSIEREKVSQWVNQQMTVYRTTVFILTSRPHGYLSNPVERVGTVLEVLPFNSQQVRDFIISLYRQNEIMRTGRKSPAVLSDAEKLANDLITRIEDNPAIAAMAKNPLLLTMIANAK